MDGQLYDSGDGEALQLHVYFDVVEDFVGGVTDLSRGSLA
jgi:hypothetical protein